MCLQHTFAKGLSPFLLTDSSITLCYQVIQWVLMIDQYISITPPDYFATFRLPPELLTVPTHDLERFILSQRTYSIFVPLYFGLSLRTTDSNCQFKVMSLMCYHYTNPPYNETISPGFTYGLFPITCCRAQQSRDLNRVYRAVSNLPIVIATHLEVSSPFRETLSPSVSFI